MTLDLIAWELLAAYVVHLLDETLMNGGFVHQRRREIARNQVVFSLPFGGD